MDEQEKQFEKPTALDRIMDLVLCPVLAFFCWPLFALDAYDMYKGKHYKDPSVAFRVVSMVDSTKQATYFTPFAEFFFHFITSVLFCSFFLEGRSVWFWVGLNYFVANIVCYAEFRLVKYMLAEQDLESDMYYVRNLASKCGSKAD